MSLRAIVTGTAMMSSVRVLRLLAQFVAIPILARLLSPEDYGVVAIAMPFVLFAMMLADAGIGMSLVRAPLSDRRAWSGCFWLSALLGVAFAAVMALLAGPMAGLFDEPSLRPIVGALAIAVVMQGLQLILVAALQQAGRFKTIAGIELVATLLSIAAALYLAVNGAGAWALVGQQIAFYAIRLALVAWYSPFKPQWLYGWTDIREHVRFGRDVLGINFVQFCARSVDTLIVGKALGAGPVGVYSVAFQFARLPAMLVAGPLQYVLYAQIIPLRTDTAAIARIFLLLTRLLAIGIFPLMGLVAAAHAPVFTFLLSEKWAMAGTIFLIVAPAAALQAVTAIGETVLMALDHTRAQLRATAELAALWLLALAIGVNFGLLWAAAAYTLVTIGYSLRYLTMLLGYVGCPWQRYARALLTPLLMTGAGIALYLLLRGDVLSLNLLLCGSLAVAASAVGAGLEWRSLRREIAALRMDTRQDHVGQE